jgi:protein ImuA
MAGAPAPDRLCRLRETIENIQHFQFDKEKPPLRLGSRPDSPTGPRLDDLLGGGLAFGALHEMAPQRAPDFGAATGFTLALAALSAKRATEDATQRGRETLWIQTDYARLEGGAIHGAGLDLFGLPSHRLLVLRARRAIDALFAMEEALKCRALASVIAELPDDGTDLTATRRLSLAAREGNGLGLLLRHRSSSLPSAAMTRWSVAALPGTRDEFGGLGRTSFLLSLVKNRRGPCGRLSIAWDHHECVFVPESVAGTVIETDSVAVAAAPADRPPVAALA